MNVLAIGAHYDDIEIGCGGSIAKHRAEGDRVIMLVITHSSYTDNRGNVIRTKEVADAEGRKAAKILDCELICLNYETKEVNFDYRLIRDIEMIINDNQIDLIYTHWDKDVHQDHQAVGKATANAGRKADSILMYRSNLYMNTQSFNANYYVDISDHLETKFAAIEAHENEVRKFGEDWLEFWKNEAMNNGKYFNVKGAEAFQVVKLLR